MLKEFCAENFTDIPKAIEQGVKRIELCDNLTVGGTTPSAGVIETTVQYAHENNVTVMTIIRPRGGNFVYNDYELKIMETDLIEAKKYGIIDEIIRRTLILDDILFGLMIFFRSAVIDHVIGIKIQNNGNIRRIFNIIQLINGIAGNRHCCLIQ